MPAAGRPQSTGPLAVVERAALREVADHRAARSGARSEVDCSRTARLEKRRVVQPAVGDLDVAGPGHPGEHRVSFRPCGRREAERGDAGRDRLQPVAAEAGAVCAGLQLPGRREDADDRAGVVAAATDDLGLGDPTGDDDKRPAEAPTVFDLEIARRREIPDDRLLERPVRIVQPSDHLVATRAVRHHPVRDAEATPTAGARRVVLRDDLHEAVALVVD